MAHVPTDSSVIASAEGFRKASKFSQNFVLDRTIVDVIDWTLLNVDGTTAAIALGTGGAPSLVDPNSTLFVGVDFEDGDTLGFLWVLPEGIDATKQIDFRYLWSSGDTSGSSTITMLYHPVDTSLATSSNTLAVGTTSMGTDFTGAATSVADEAVWSSWASIAADTTGVKTLVGADDMLCCKFTSSATTLDDYMIHKVQARYYKKHQQ